MSQTTVLNLSMNQKKEPYYIVRNKLIISRYLSDLRIIDLIINMLLYQSCIVIKYNKGGVFRSLKILKINLFLYKLIKHEIEDLLGFQISKKEKDAYYSLSEIYSIGYFLRDFTIQDATTPNIIISFDDFCLCDDQYAVSNNISKNNTSNIEKKYKIISVNSDTYVKYDSTCGLDILLILAIKLYGLKCKKISKMNREKLKIKGIQTISS